jgi:hypothetical protein
MRGVSREVSAGAEKLRRNLPASDFVESTMGLRRGMNRVAVCCGLACAQLIAGETNTVLTPRGGQNGSAHTPGKAAAVLNRVGESFRLTGVIEFGAFRKAYLVGITNGQVQSYFSLSEGEKEAGLEITRIEAKSAVVWGRYEEVEVMLSLRSHGFDAQAVYLQNEYKLGMEHGEYHEKQARLERERDARELLEFQKRQQLALEEKNETE